MLCPYQGKKIITASDSINHWAVNSSSECRFGWNSLALEHVLEEFMGKKEHEQYVLILWDEIAITKDLTFDNITLKCKRIVDYAGE